MREVLKKLAPALRIAGFRGSGQSYRKAEGDFIFVINFQVSRLGDTFSVNLGAQPIFIPAECDADLKQLKEHESVLRGRVGGKWPRQMSDERAEALQAEIISTQKSFFGHAQTMPAALAVDSPDVLIEKFSTVTTRARAALHLARAELALGHRDKARALADRGLELAADRATVLRSELSEVLESVTRTAEQ